MSTLRERAEVSAEGLARRGRRARVMDCQVKALRASSVEMKLPGGTVVVASDLRVVRELAEKMKYAQVGFESGGCACAG
jgi:hypothetical protein